MTEIQLNTARFTREGRTIPTTEIGQGNNQATVYKYRDALNFAHSVGLRSIESRLILELCDVAKGIYVAGSKVTFTDGSFFTGIGDATPDNTNRMVGKHLPRMAETRAKARALGDALNLDAVFKDEIGGDDNEEAVVFTPRTQPRQASGQMQAGSAPEFNVPDGYACDDCGNELKDTAKSTAAKKAEWSIKKTGRILCWNCQQANG